MDPANPRAEAVVIDTQSGTISAVGTLADCQQIDPDAAVTDLGSTVLMPGFVEAHSHPVLSGMATQEPSYWIAPYVGYPNFSDVQALWTKLDKEMPAGQGLIFNGLDRILQDVEEPTSAQLDEYFPDRPVIVLDNSGHEVYFNTANMALLGWEDNKPPADPEGAHFGRNEDGTSNGRAYETAAVFAAAGPLLKTAIPHPLQSGARWYRYMASFGITSTSEMAYSTDMLGAYSALAMAKDCPLRVSLYHMAIDADCGEPITNSVPDTMVRKQGIKLWADGSPWVGTVANSYPYLDSDVVRKAGIPIGPGGESVMNYTRAQLDELLAAHASQGWQMAFHVNGDVGLDIVLDAYEHALTENKLLGTDHRWRIEHCGGCRGDQFERAVSLGVHISMGPFQFIYWGDKLDGELYPTEIGSQWMRWGDAVRAGAVVSFHNDGSVSPPNPLLNVQTAITRMTPSGAVRGPNQIISLEDALKAETINGALTLHREHEIGSVEVGKFADFVELSQDPYLANPTTLASQVKVNGTWLNGRKIDTDAFLAEVQVIDPTDHEHLATKATEKCC